MQREQRYRPDEAAIERLIRAGEARDWLEAAAILAARAGLIGEVLLIGPEGPAGMVILDPGPREEVRR